MLISDLQDEKELLSRIAAGDRLAFGVLFDFYHHRLGSFIFGITKSIELAEEITLDVFLKIWMTREVLTDVRNFQAYLFTVSRNVAVGALRKIVRERTQRSAWLKDPSAEFKSDGEEKEIYLSLIEEAIDRLSPQRKKIYLLSRKEGLAYQEIAGQLGLSKFTVRAHIQQAVDAIVQFVKTRSNAELLLIWIVLFLKKYFSE